MSVQNSIVDQHQRPIRDLRISVIDQCNFRCTYCMPAEIFGPDYAFLKEHELLSFPEIITVAKQFAKMGVTKLRLTGGEPLLRKGLPDLIHELININGIEDIALTTNGVFLPKYAEELKKAGLQRVNISLDALDDKIFGAINGKNVKVSAVLKGIDAAIEASLGVKINMVVKKGLNDQEILGMAKYFKNKKIILRFIEFMDVGNTNQWKLNDVVTKKQIIDMIQKELPLKIIKENYFGEVADRYQYKDGSTEIGIISSVTDSFCSSCTRARLSADGKLYTCLFAQSGFDLRTILRSKVDEKEIANQIESIWKKRDDRYSDERMHTKKVKSKVEMSYIGG